MIAEAVGPYEQALAGNGRVGLQDVSGRFVPLSLDRYLADADAADQTVLDTCSGPTLDVGCGPGRIVRALTARGIPALGVDIAPTAVELSVRRGGMALSRNVFEPLPGEGRWYGAVVLDGNVGIGGDLRALIVRLVELVMPGGLVVLEASAVEPDTYDVLTTRFTVDDEVVGPEFRWTVAGSQALVATGSTAGLSVRSRWTYADREFVAFRSRTTPTPSTTATSTA